MGISQLLPLLEPSTRNCHISEFRGHTVAIDSYCWLHKGSRSCALQLAKGEKTDAYVQYCMKYIRLLQSFGVNPIMVFDGRPLPAKAGTEERRRESKAQARKQGMEYMRLGQMDDAYKSFCQSIDVTPQMALDVIQACRINKIDYIVAPYEADAQLAFLNINNLADCVISEDSDLLVFGCKKVLYKMDASGAGQLVDADKIHVSMKMRIEKYSFKKFRYMCILSGCDYLDSLPGIGLKKALKFITLTAETDPAVFLDRIPRYLKMKNLTIPEDYKENFFVADATFEHQVVFDPVKKVLLNLQPIGNNAQYCRNSGEMFDNDEAFQLAIGNLNPLNMEQLDNWDPSEMLGREFSIWSPLCEPYSKPVPIPTQSQSLLSKTIDLEVIEISDEEYDEHAEHEELMKRELEFYRTPVEIYVALIEPNSPTAELKTSPVLGSNPFIKKNISKFQETPGTSQQKVTSRFFSSNVVRAVAQTSSCTSSSPLHEAEDDQPLIPEGEASSLVTSDAHSLEASGSNNVSLKVHVDNELPGTSTSDAQPQFEGECNFEEEDTEGGFAADSTTLTSVENIPSGSSSEKRKLEAKGK